MRITDHALNRLNLLKAIRRWGPIARTDLTTKTELSSGSITQLTAELLKRGLVIERKDQTKRNGRPRTYLEINAGGALVIGSSLGGVGILNSSFMDLMGNRLHSTESRLAHQSTLAGMAEEIGANLAQAISSSPFSTHNIGRVGIALPALIDTSKGDVHFMTTFPAGEPVPFAGPISERLGLPVTIENDNVCMARAEHWFGRARDLETFTLIHVGYAIGLAQYEDGLPKSGANGLNSELGHIKSVTGKDARPCFCGGRGCLTSYASMYGILKAADQLVGAPFPPTGSLDERFEKFMTRADQGDVAFTEALDQAGGYLGLALANLINSTDPGNVLITFANTRFMSAIAEPMDLALRTNIMPGALPATKIELVASDPDWRWKGTAALALEQTYIGAA
jgi:predicted NBD/HSP70 family sugar kinase